MFLDGERARVTVFRVYPVRCWRSSICNLQGNLVSRADVELLDRSSSGSETPILAASDPKDGDPDTDLSRICNAPKPG